jgi:hypothetical protein
LFRRIVILQRRGIEASTAARAVFLFFSTHQVTTTIMSIHALPPELVIHITTFLVAEIIDSKTERMFNEGPLKTHVSFKVKEERDKALQGLHSLMWSCHRF